MNRRSLGCLVLAIGCLIPCAQPIAQGTADPWYGRIAKSKDFDAPKVFTGVFSVELPKDWQLGTGHMETLFVLTQRTKKWEAGATITLKQNLLQETFDPTLVKAVGDKEMRDARAFDSTGRNFSVSTMAGEHGPVILVQYDRRGMSGTDDHIAIYAIPVGTVMYHLVCVAPSAGIDKYRPIFAHVAASFTPLKAAS